ncbi:hypothetical protein BOTBODRAFT_210230 [Botryobasidium botryosum FD-172 SS1]|uniref:Uncharacterized protein n=1 Tax=Botryobasidium botryosum (strain FD-172 SS1) TaxID=930990 RepID=A0A067N3W8_BOTB1|nr:hypothetical protein BOTBODRAFT_210230 [Botryobasidium botryosum FD-172 SS1]
MCKRLFARLRHATAPCGTIQRTNGNPGHRGRNNYEKHSTYPGDIAGEDAKDRSSCAGSKNGGEEGIVSVKVPARLALRDD